VSWRGRLAGCVLAVVAAVAVVAGSSPGIDVAAREVAGPSTPTPPSSSTSTTSPATTVPGTTSTTAPGTTSTTTAGGLDGVEPSTAECIAGDLLDDPGALLGGGDITGPATEQVGQIADAVEEERGLTFRTDVEPTFLTADEIADRVRDLSAEEYTEADADVDDRLLTALGAIPPDLDLRQAVLDLTAGQVAGYYDPSNGELVVLADDPGAPLEPGEQVTLAHELDHALTDQRLDQPAGDSAPASDDAATAALALVEGDATLLMQRFALAHVGIQGLLDSAGGPETAAAEEQLAGMPPFLRSNLLFPYLEGLGFVCSLLAGGGWEAVDEAYADPPATTAEVLFPERYGDDRPDAPPAGRPGAGWEEVAREPLGAAPLLWLLEAPGGDESAALDDPTGRAAAWAADEVAVFARGDETAVGLTIVPTAGSEPGSLCETVVDWYRASFPDAADAGTTGDEALAVEDATQSAVVGCGAGTAPVRLGIAPDLDTARRLAAG
jgi:hypothetical protein